MATPLFALTEVLKDLDGVQDPDERWELAIRGVFAGNIFDLGAAASEELFASEGSSFQAL
jgi:type II pantothenate kinase